MVKTQLDLSIVIPFKDKSELTLACLHTLQRYNKDLIKEIILVSNNSSDAEIKIIEDAIGQYENVRLEIDNIPFNFQSLNNHAIAKSSGKVVMMLNNDTEFTDQSKGLLGAMYRKALETKVGAVGAVLLFEDRKTIQHAGVYLVPGGTADHLYIGQKLDRVLNSTTAKFNIKEDLRVSAVTAAAVMIRKDHYDEIHGMNENFIVGGGDVDLCLRLEDAGYENYVVGCKNGIIIHKESKTRVLSHVPYSDFCESYLSYSKHFDLVKGDKYLPWSEVKHV